MDDGEIESSRAASIDFHNNPYSNFLDDSSVIQSDWDVSIGTQICSHKHICNPTTGPDNTHTHTCEHTHTHTIESGDGDDEKVIKKRRPAGNKEAVRKYREKQKAVKVNLEVRNAELEKENQKIPMLVKENGRLRRKIQELGPRQDAVENLLTENKKLRGLLSSFRRAIDSELDEREDVSYQNHVLTPGKLKRVADSPSRTHCATPVPCFPPAHHHHQKGEVTDGRAHMEESPGWYAECEMVTVAPCNDATEELKDDVDPPRTLAATATSASKREEALQYKVKSATAMTAAFGENLLPGRTVTATETVPFQDHTDGVACPVAALPFPCLNTGLRASLSENRAMDCDNSCDGAQTTGDSSCPVVSDSASANEITRSISTQISEQTLFDAGSSKDVDIVGIGSAPPVDLFPPSCIYSDDGAPESPVAATCWGDHSVSPVVSDSWLEDCDFIGGVCQAQLESAMKFSCDAGTNTLPTAVCNH